ncbi:MAG: DUF262 domain-containing protein [Alphaproteobacteria bacterium]|nr:DUF262 domain-containing protein [Alphaproteobacteria bacterium]
MDDVRRGHLVLPDFQRSFIWKPDDVRDLLISVLGDYYVGSMLYMDAIRDESPFALRMIEGIDKIIPTPTIDSIVKILLDGQQRTSSLFYALFAPEIPLSGRKNPFRFYANVPALLAENWDEAVNSVNTGNKRTMLEMEDNEDYIDMTEFKDAGALTARLQKTKYETKLPDILRIVIRFMSYEIQMVHLDRGTSLDRVVETFERINRTGEPLSIMDLLVAKVYKENVKLRDMIQNAEENFRFLEQIDSEYILRVMCLLRGFEVRRQAMLDLSPAAFREDWDFACFALEEAYTRMTDTKNGYGIIDFKKWAPFTTMLVPLAACIAYLEKNNQRDAVQFRKIDRWYWASVFLNRYNEGVNTKTFSDFIEMKDWFKEDKNEPEFIRRVFEEEVDLRVESRSAAMYKGVMCLVVLSGALDFQTGQPPQFAVGEVQDDHIFPKSLYTSDQLMNRTLISTNQKKSNQTPSRYFSALETVTGRQRLEEILATHLIDANALSALLKDDLQGFCKAREQATRDKIRAFVTP